MDIFKKLYLLNIMVVIIMLPAAWVMFNHNTKRVKEINSMIKRESQNLENGSQDPNLDRAGNGTITNTTNSPDSSNFSGTGEILDFYSDGTTVRLTLFRKDSHIPVILESQLNSSQGLILSSLASKKGMTINYQGIRVNASQADGTILLPTAIWY